MLSNFFGIHLITDTFLLCVFLEIYGQLKDWSTLKETSDGLESGLNFAILVANTELVSICFFNTLHKKYRSTFGLNAYGEWMHLLLSSVKEP